MAYAPDIVDECRRLFVERGLTPTQIAAVMGGKPSRAVVSGWSNAPDDDGRTWHDARAEHVGGIDLHEMTPRNLARKLLGKIDQILDRDDLDSKAGNTIAQLNRTLQDLAGPAFMVPAMYEVLTDLVLFLRGHRPELLTEDFLEAVRMFKDTLRQRLGEPGRRITEGG